MGKQQNQKSKFNKSSKDSVKLVKDKKPQVDEKTKKMRVLYNKLMQKEKTDKITIVKNLMNLMDKSYEAYCYKHDGCRILQGCLKYGAKEQRNKIIENLIPLLYEIIIGKYSIYLAAKIFKYADNEQKNTIFKKVIKPNFLHLLKYSGGISFMKIVFNNSTSNYHEQLIDLYIKDYFKIPFDKIKLLKEVENEKNTTENKNDDEDVEMKNENNVIIENSGKYIEADKICTQIKEHLEKQLELGINKNFIFHGFLNKLFDELDTKTQSYVADLFDDDFLPFLDNNYGFEIAMKLYSVAQAKTRKKIIKLVRNEMDNYLNNENGIYLITKIILFTDDTVLVNKTFLNGIIDKLNENFVENKNCIKIVWNILYPGNKKCNTSNQQKLLNFSTNISNKKSIEKRKSELISHIFEKLFKIVNYAIKFLSKDLLFSNFLTDFLNYLVENKEIEKIEQLLNSISNLIQEDYKQNKDTIDNCILVDKVGQLTVNRILKDLSKIEGEAKKYEISFAKNIADILKSNLDKFLNTKAIFIIVQLMENTKTKNLISKELNKFKGEILKNKDNNKLSGMKLLAKQFN